MQLAKAVLARWIKTQRLDAVIFNSLHATCELVMSVTFMIIDALSL